MTRITLRAARVNAGYTQKEAACLLSVSNKTLSLWEQGAAYPKADKIAKICALYGVSYDNLIFLPHTSL